MPSVFLTLYALYLAMCPARALLVVYYATFADKLRGRGDLGDSNGRSGTLNSESYDDISSLRIDRGH
ncbi:hypothetical protein VTN49DRAFT_1760 [Thermomyces lanuginosus]|uniref:uncharacterized protein n=1 Tax=Thermomyces lanuginosus TaxID=5541 RepID=UPI003741F138